MYHVFDFDMGETYIFDTEDEVNEWIDAAGLDKADLESVWIIYGKEWKYGIGIEGDDTTGSS